MRAVKGDQRLDVVAVWASLIVERSGSLGSPGDLDELGGREFGALVCGVERFDDDLD